MKEQYILGKAKEHLKAGDIVFIEKRKWWQRFPRIRKVKNDK